MSSDSIFVCHDCRDVEESAFQYPGEWGRKSIFNVTLDELVASEYLGRYKDMEEWITGHRDHDAMMCSDAHGTFEARQYNFDRRSFGGLD